ncbi:hypothetical protein BDV98DRAFT_582275 [Pterulicium gracile]|uniref:Uncharacterized protein n=1 Tax=Pterulicium gracile TaxID=1884261 RepID=A0A5C3QN04_9AGAR|nr:hypothetical protein BDV98DRAFT_582275 [Pterula gracilis]
MTFDGSGDCYEDAKKCHGTTYPYCAAGLWHQVKYNRNPQASAQAKKQAATVLQKVQKTKAADHQAMEAAVQITLTPVIFHTVNAPAVILPNPKVSSHFYQWSNNSCWFDTALYLFYTTLLNDMEAVENCIAACSHEELCGYLVLKHFVSWWELEIKSGTVCDAPFQQQTFSAVRNIICQNWFSNCRSTMAQVVKKRLLGPPRLFRRVFIKLTSCSGSDYSGGLVHYCSSRQAKQMFRWDLGIDKIMDYNGDINMLVQNWCNVEQQPRVHPKYFRAVFKTGEALCSGSPLVILVFDIQGSTGGASEHAAAHCVFPEVIYPFEDNSSFWYKIQGCAFFLLEQAHYVCRVRAGAKTFFYDSNKKEGCALLEQDSTVTTHLAGSAVTIPNVPQTFHTCAVTYRLISGIKAQDRFYTSQSLLPTSKVNKLTAQLPVIEPDDSSAVVLISQTTRKEWSHSNTLKLYYNTLPLNESHAEPVSTAMRSSRRAAPHTELTQRRGRADNLGNDEDFICDCLATSSVLLNQLEKDWWKKCGYILLAVLPPLWGLILIFGLQDSEVKAPKCPSLKDWLLAGAFALLALGKFWYPVRIIQTPLEGEPDKCTINIWAGCNNFIDPKALKALHYVAPRVYSVSEVVLQDAMRWDKKAQYSMPLGHWTNAKMPEEIYHEKPNTTPTQSAGPALPSDAIYNSGKSEINFPPSPQEKQAVRVKPRPKRATTKGGKLNA